MILKKIDPLSAAKISGIIAAAIGLLAGLLLFLFGGLLGGLAGAQEHGTGAGLAALGGGALGIIVLPIVYGIFGFIGGLIQAFVYNIAARFVGGVRIETE